MMFKSTDPMDEVGSELMEEVTSGSHLKDSQSSDADERFDEPDAKKIYIYSKVEKIKEKIKAANKTQQNDVEEFLRVNAQFSPNVTVSENPQLARIRQAFEKKNKKSTQLIQSLQKKLDHYQQMLKSIESGLPTPPLRRLKPDNVLSSVGQGLKDVGANIKGYTGTVISVPKDIANRFLKRSGSVDNIPAIHQHQKSVSHLTNNETSKHKASTLGASGRSTFYANLGERLPKPSDHFYLPIKTVPDRLVFLGSTDVGNLSSISGASSHRQQPRSSTPLQQQQQQQQNLGRFPTPDYQSTHENDQNHLVVSQLDGHLNKLNSDVENCREELNKMNQLILEMKVQFQQEFALFHSALHEEKFRAQRLEDQINDQIELNHAETTNLRSEVQNLEGRLSYQVNSRVEDVQDEYGKLSSEVNLLKGRLKEVQQFVGMEGFEGASVNAKWRRGCMLLVQFVADFLLLLVSVLNRPNVKASLMLLFVAFVVYHLGGYLFWNFLVFIFQKLFRHPLVRQESTTPNIAENFTAAIQ